MEINLTKEFTQEELKYINHLRLVFKAGNPNLRKKYNHTYIPLGLAIVYIIKIEDKTKRTLNEDIYVVEVLKKYLRLSRLISELLKNDTLTLIDPITEAPYPDGTIKKQLKKLDNNHANKWMKLFLSTSDNYARVLASWVSYDELLTSMEALKGISNTDSRIKALNSLKDCVNNPEKLKHYCFQHDDIFYYYRGKSIKIKSKNKKQDNNPHMDVTETTNKKKNEKPKGKKQLEREALLKTYLEDTKKWITPTLLKDKDNYKDNYKDKNIKTNTELWEILSGLNGSLFPKCSAKRTVDAFFDLQELCTFDEGKFNRINQKK